MLASLRQEESKVLFSGKNQKMNHDDTTNTTGFYVVLVVSSWLTSCRQGQEKRLCILLADCGPLLTGLALSLYSCGSFCLPFLCFVAREVTAVQNGFVDIHCHFLPGIDDGSPDWETTIGMAQMAVADGTQVLIVTPHQLGNYPHNLGDDIRARTLELQQVLDQQGIALRVLPGGDVRIEEGMVEGLVSGEVMSLGDLRSHVLLELPHELYFPIEGVLASLKRQGMTGILSHPERNRGLLREPDLLPALVEGGCLMQVTAGSLMGTFGPSSQQLAEWMLSEGLVHFIATDAHGTKSRRPLMRRAFERVAELTDQATAEDLCCHHPALVARGKRLPAGRRALPKRGGWRSFFTAKKVG